MANTAYAELPKTNPKLINNKTVLPQSTNKSLNRLNLKADLIIEGIGYSNEFCVSSCSDQWTRELQVECITAESCYLKVKVI